MQFPHHRQANTPAKQPCHPWAQTRLCSRGRGFFHICIILPSDFLMSDCSEPGTMLCSLGTEILALTLLHIMTLARILELSGTQFVHLGDGHDRGLSCPSL